MTRGAPGEVYRRYGNATVDQLAECVARLEGGEAGLCVGSGMAAVTASLFAAGALSGRAKVLCARSTYGSTFALCDTWLRNVCEVRFVDMANTERAVHEIRSFCPDIVYTETSSNPMTWVTDLEKIAGAAKEARPSCVVITDNTFAPLLVRPLSLGVDIVLHSVTKYIGGHGDLLAGCVVGSKKIIALARQCMIDFGLVLGPFDAFLATRGVRTLSLRMERHNENAMHVARFLSCCPHVERTYYPGLETHPQHTAAVAMFRGGFGGMVAFQIKAPAGKGGLAAQAFLDSLRLIANQVSLGHVDSLASCPALGTQAQVDEETRAIIGITDATIRLSVGLEDKEDIVADLGQALDVASKLNV